MSPLLNPIDELDTVFRLFQAAELAVHGLSLEHERKPLDALFLVALERMEKGLDQLKDLLEGEKA